MPFRKASLFCFGLWAGTALSASVTDCRSINDPAKRLACYDALGEDAAVPAPPPSDPVAGGGPPPAKHQLGSSLSERWELDPEDKQGTFIFRPYRSVYVLPVRWMNSPNNTPQSPNPTNSSSADLNLQNIEAKFQISFKTKLWQNIFSSPVDFWFGYTQRSFWQVYNKEESSPFRETNYEPELFFTIPSDLRLGSLGWRYTNLGMVHQSNGRADPYSRSWNRLYAAFGFESGDWAFQIRPWLRIKEDAAKDNNPDIENYAGRGDAALIYKHDGHIVTLSGNHSLRGGDENHGGLQVEWAFPIAGYLRGHVQAFTGYGESLIDYNHRQSSIGLGVSLVEAL
ncbi:phospholipase A [Niveibacterium sp. SC-1]|uniref:phospholipase A n=1 Tax=Niveibacterium sp. SC-1 TaxID=3135646 RepID=UPI00311D6CF2